MPDATVAAGLVRACAGRDQLAESAFRDERLQRLPRAGVDIEGNAIMNFAVLRNGRGNRENRDWRRSRYRFDRPPHLPPRGLAPHSPD